MEIIYSKNNIPLRITQERLGHIYRGHPETKNQENEIINTIENPDIIFAGDYGELLACKFYEKTPVTFDKYLIAVYKETSEYDGFLITAYYTRKLTLNRRIIWKL